MDAFVGIQVGILATRNRVTPCRRRRALVLAAVKFDWAEEGGIVCDCLGLHNFPGGVRGMMALRPIKKSEVIVTVPKRTVIETNSIPQKNPVPRFVSSKFWSSETWWVRVGILLLHQKIEKPDEPLGGYTKALPKSFDTPFHWNDKQLAETQYPQFQKQVKAQQKEWRQIYDRLQRNYTGSRPISFDEFVWALECVRSRAFSGEIETTPFKERLRTFAFAGVLSLMALTFNLADSEQVVNGLTLAVFSLMAYDFLYPRIQRAVTGEENKRYIMCPIVDFCNHRSGIDSDLSFEYFYDRFVLKTEEFAKGEQVFISYGNRSNDQLLQYYGFVEENNPNDVYVFGGNLESVMQQLNVETSSLSPEQKEIGPISVSRGRPAFSDAVTKQLVQVLGDAKRVEDFLVDLCRSELEKKATTIEEDRALSKRSLAVAFRIEKKQLLRETLKTLSTAEVEREKLAR
mmetsp:Transcript_5977/g.18002  ORF Transcript_5977/g.18002 Transcript_5977/m.18002 type:complete len:458 (-) Transcript_5977:1345-2718(-)